MMIQYDIDLKMHNTFGISCRAARYATVGSEDDIFQLREHPLFDDKWLILGGGSNILFTRDISEPVIRISIPGIEVKKEDNKNVWIEVGAGVIWHYLVTFAIDRNWAGIENLSLIPGTVGAAPIQNIGAYGVELTEVFDYLIAVDRLSKEVVRFEMDDCRFAYRDSVFKNEYKDRFIITRVGLKLSKIPDYRLDYGDIRKTLEEMGVSDLSLKAVSDAVINIRRSKLPDPAKIGNAGSFFKNPVIGISEYQKLKKTYPELPGYPADEGFIKAPAGWLIDKAGWKGYRKGDAGVHEKQALVLVNYGTAKGSDLLELSEKIKTDIHQKFGIVLTGEVNIAS